jgi:hypothetical protein
LLQNGADPNIKFNGFSAWQNCLSTEYKNPVRRVSLLKVLLLHGADANACVETKMDGQQTALAVIQRNFDEFLAGNPQATQSIILRSRVDNPTLTIEAVSAETLAQLKLDIIELKDMLIKASAKDVHGKVRIRSLKINGERVTLLIKLKRILGKGRK